MIEQSFIDDLVARSDIVDIISQRVALKKSGHEFKACCPFHGEKTPSFFVSPQKQFYHCFGCGEHGTVIGFLMNHDHLGFVEAIEFLAGQLGLEVPRDGKRQHRPDAQLVDIVGKASAFFREQLKKTPAAIDYLKRRGVDGKTAAEFGLGFAPDAWDGLLRHLGHSAEAVQALKAGGLIVERDNGGHYDRFRNRVIFPIRDNRGRNIAFGGRILGDQQPKYLNSPETALFHKGRELYGLFEARQALRQIPQLVVVEGYMDVVALAQHGIRNAVATLGTATTPDHLRKLFRLTNTLVFCFDGDRAGRAAAWRALENVLPEVRDGRQIRFLFLSEGDDPDTLVRRTGADGFEARMRTALPLSNYLIDKLTQEADIASVDGRAQLVDAVKPLLARMPDPVYRQMLLEELATRVRMSADGLQRLLARSIEPKSPRADAPPGRRAPHARRRQKDSPMQHAIALLLQQPALAADITDTSALRATGLAGMALMVEILEFIHTRPQITTAGIVEHWRAREDGAIVASLAARTLMTPSEGFKHELQGHLERFLAQQREVRFEALRARSLSSLSAAEKAELRELSRQS